jgi:hypothetical protein
MCVVYYEKIVIPSVGMYYLFSMCVFSFGVFGGKKRFRFSSIRIDVKRTLQKRETFHEESLETNSPFSVRVQIETLHYIEHGFA